MDKHRKQQRRDFAKKQQNERDKRSPKEQLALLDERLGVGIGATRERIKLTELIETIQRKQDAKHRKNKNV